MWKAKDRLSFSHWPLIGWWQLRGFVNLTQIESSLRAKCKNQ